MVRVALLAVVGLSVGCPSRVTTDHDVQTIVPGDVSAGTSALAVVHPALAAIDVPHGNVLIHRSQGVDVLELATGKLVAHADLGWTGEVWPATRYLIAFHASAPLAIEATLIDPPSARREATCSHVVEAPAGAHILRIDEFEAKGTLYLKWETGPPPGPMRGGRAVTAEEVAAWQQSFYAAYSCGLASVRVTSKECTLEPATFKQAGLESCETRQMPGHRLMPSTVGDLRLRVDDRMGPAPPGRGGEVEDVIFIVDGKDGNERWRTEITHKDIAPPAPAMRVSP
jgi:hypothetical protein